jgi:hypothetical protein
MNRGMHGRTDEPGGFGLPFASCPIKRDNGRSLLHRYLSLELVQPVQHHVDLHPGLLRVGLDWTMRNRPSGETK